MQSQTIIDAKFEVMKQAKGSQLLKNSKLDLLQAKVPSAMPTISLENLENIQTRKIMQDKTMLEEEAAIEDPFSDKIFVLQRIIGYDDQLQVKPSMQQLIGNKIRNEISLLMKQRVTDHLQQPSSWKLITKRNKRCWVCDRKIYSLILWNNHIGRFKSLNIKNQSQIMANLKRLPYKTERPVIYCFDNDWKAQEMHTISEFCFIIDKRKKGRLQKIPAEKIRDFEF